MSQSNEPSVLEVIAEQRGGECLIELTAKMADVIAAVRHYGGAGKLSITLIVKAQTGGAMPQVYVEDKIVATLPELKRMGTLFFTNDKNGLQKEDPFQEKLPLQFAKLGAAEKEAG